MKDKKPYIEEMAKAVCHLDRTCDECMTSFECKAMMYAKRFYNAGYRKASEVAREIFEDMQSCLVIRHWHGNDILTFEFDAVKYAKLKKKYTESEKDNGEV